MSGVVHGALVGGGDNHAHNHDNHAHTHDNHAHNNHNHAHTHDNHAHTHDTHTHQNSHTHNHDNHAYNHDSNNNIHDRNAHTHLGHAHTHAGGDIPHRHEDTVIDYLENNNNDNNNYPPIDNNIVAKVSPPDGDYFVKGAEFSLLSRGPVDRERYESYRDVTRVEHTEEYTDDGRGGPIAKQSAVVEVATSDRGQVVRYPAAVVIEALPVGKVSGERLFNGRFKGKAIIIVFLVLAHNTYIYIH